MSASPPGHAGVVSGVLNMTRGIGTALGVALGVALFTAGAHNATGTVSAGRGLALALLALGAIALATALALILRRPAVPGTTPSDRRAMAADRPEPSQSRSRC